MESAISAGDTVCSVSMMDAHPIRDAIKNRIKIARIEVATILRFVIRIGYKFHVFA